MRHKYNEIEILGGMNMMENRHHALGLSDEQVLEMYETMLLSRKLDERLWLLNRAGKIPFVVSCQGQEAAQVGAAFALNRKEDYVLPYYRDLGVVLAFGMTAKDLMLSNFAKAEDPNSGGDKCQVILDKRKIELSQVLLLLRLKFPMRLESPLAARMARRKYCIICYVWRRFIKPR